MTAGDALTCPAPPATPASSGAVDQAAWHFARGYYDYCTTDFDQALAEFQDALRFTPRSPDVIYNIAATHFALQEYEDALAWYRRYLETGDARYRAMAEARVRQLLALPAHVTVFTEPHDGDDDHTVITFTPAEGGEKITAHWGEKVKLAAGDWDVHVERPGFKPHDDRIHLSIGDQQSFSWQLEQRRGTVLVAVSPGDAGPITLTIDNYVANMVSTQPLGKHHLRVKAPGYYPRDLAFDVTSDEVPTAVGVSLKPLPVSGFWEFVAGSTIAGAAAGALTILTVAPRGNEAFAGLDQSALLGAGVGAGVGAIGSIYGARRGINFGSAVFILGDAGIGTVEGGSLADTLHLDPRAMTGFAAGGLATGFIVGTALAGGYHPSGGKALLFDSIAGWGVTAGVITDNAFFTQSAGTISQHPYRGPLVLAGTNLGLAAAAYFAPKHDWSAWHVALVDGSGVVGVGLGLLTYRLVRDLHAVIPPSDLADAQYNARFELAGMAVGLVAGTFLFSDFDSAPVDEALGGTAQTARATPFALTALSPEVGPDYGPGGRTGTRFGLDLAGRF